MIHTVGQEKKKEKEIYIDKYIIELIKVLNALNHIINIYIYICFCFFHLKNIKTPISLIFFLARKRSQLIMIII